MANYPSSYTGSQVDTAVGKALNPDSVPTSGSTNLITSGGVYSVLGDINTALAAIIGEDEE